MKKLLALGLVVIGLMSVGCSGSSEGEDNSPAPKGTVPSTIGNAPTPPGGNAGGEGR